MCQGLGDIKYRGDITLGLKLLTLAQGIHKQVNNEQGCNERYVRDHGKEDSFRVEEAAGGAFTAGAHGQRGGALYLNERDGSETQGSKSSVREVAERAGRWAEAKR